ncbi:MAG TPA: SagB/ThcOx family dehydrogenase [Candidatus Korarchaeota archaeon]|nr:SagB/ThcOx family dehydrogenase [Candidatus Korarchaeota archaeon]
MRYPSAKVSLAIASIALFVTLVTLHAAGVLRVGPAEERAQAGERVALPQPILKGNMSVEEAIATRRSVRKYSDEPLTLQELGQLLWAAQGITDVKRGFRAAPSAGATYPLELFVVVRDGGVVGLGAGIYAYDPWAHSLSLVRAGDFGDELADAALGQEWVRSAPACIVIVANYSRTMSVYGSRGERYVHMEAGHVGQNIYLQATALGLGTVAVGAFHDGDVAEILQTELAPLYIFPVGRRE